MYRTITTGYENPEYSCLKILLPNVAQTYPRNHDLNRLKSISENASTQITPFLANRLLRITSVSSGIDVRWNCPKYKNPNAFHSQCLLFDQHYVYLIVFDCN